MNYRGRALGADTQLSVEAEGLRIGGRFVDFADVACLTPMNHRVLIDTQAGERIEVSMLGFSYDGFWKELTDCFGARSLQSLFVDEQQLMLIEGEYVTPVERGRAQLALYPDAICILPETMNALRIPLCFTASLTLSGYMLEIVMADGTRYSVGKMGYDTHPFAERAQKNAVRVKKERAAALAALPLTAPFTHKGLFRTGKPEQYWQCAAAPGRCAVELFVGEDAATYLYRFPEQEQYLPFFLAQLEMAMEAMGTHREIIYYSDEQLSQTPLYRMSVQRSQAVRVLRAHSAGRLIHNAGHSARLAEFLA